MKINQGSSALSLYNLAKKKGYTLVASTEVNLFFIHNNFVKKIIDTQDAKIDDIVDDKAYRNFIFVGFVFLFSDGKNNKRVAHGRPRASNEKKGGAWTP